MKLKKIKPMFNRIITSADIYEEDQYINGLIDTTKPKGSLKEHQKVLSVGTTVRDIKVGDYVCIDPTRYMITSHKDKSIKNGIIGDEIVLGYKFNTIEVDGKKCLMLYDQDITFIIEEFEEETRSAIIQPEKPKIIV